MRGLLDIVVGDFGRPGTLRYLEVFSARERELITSRLTPGEEFLDEHRRVQLTVLCQLRIVKRRIFGRYEREGRPIDHAMMVGTSDGAPVSEIVADLGDLLRRQVEVAAGCGARTIRVVIPCNTLGLIADPLRGELDPARERLGVAVTVEPMQPLIGAELRDRAIRSVLVLGTPGSVAAYRDALTAPCPPIEVRDNPGELTTAYERCIDAAIRGERPDPEALAVVRSRADEHRGAGREVLEACTDVSLGVGSEALEIYADRLVRDAYREAE
jgi:hypothetical protein